MGLRSAGPRIQLQRLLERGHGARAVVLHHQHETAHVLRLGGLRVGLHRRLALHESLVGLVERHEVARFQEQRLRILRFGTEYLVEIFQGLVGLLVSEGQRRHSQLGGGADDLVLTERRVDRRGLSGPLGQHVVIRQRHPCVGGLRHLRRSHEKRFRLERSVCGHQEERHHAVREQVLRCDPQRIADGPLGLRRLIDRPVEVAEHEMRLRVGRCQFDRSLERSFSLVLVPTLALKRAKVGVGAAIDRIDPDCFFDLLHGAVEILESGEGRSQQDLSVRALWVLRQDRLRACLRIGELTEEQQQARRLRLHVLAIGQQIGGPDVLAGGVRDIT